MLSYFFLRRFLLFYFSLIVTICLHAQITICSWNLENFGKSKTNSVIEFIANTVKDYDVVAIQEVIAKDPGGAQAVARLNDALNRKGFKWDYQVSDITSSDNPDSRERYAFLWKTSRLKLEGKAGLEVKHNVN